MLFSVFGLGAQELVLLLLVAAVVLMPAAAVVVVLLSYLRNSKRGEDWGPAAGARRHHDLS